MYHFSITSPGPVSEAFRLRGARYFDEAAAMVKHLPYKRNKNKQDLLTVLSDGFGTCSTKHALLQHLAIENVWDGFRLMLGIFKMNAANTPPVAGTLSRYGLPYMPEAHTYLRIDGVITDCTTASSAESDFINELLLEKEIEPSQVMDFKEHFHRDFLRQWLAENQQIPYTPDELFAIREQCIHDLENRRPL